MGWVVNATPRPIYRRERLGTHCIGGRVGPRAGLNRCGYSPPTEIRFPDRQAHSSRSTDCAIPAYKGVQETLCHSFLALIITNL